MSVESRSWVGWVLAGMLGGAPVAVWAEEVHPDPLPDTGEINVGSGEEGGKGEQRETLVTARACEDSALPEGRASSTLHRADLERRLPRSAPDALRYEPGVFVQQ